MGQIQSSVGLISGINIDGTVSQLIAVSARPRDRLVNRNTALASQQTALNELLALTIGVQLSSDRLGRTSEFNTISATTSNKEVLTVSTNAKATVGSYSFRSLQTAQATSLTSGVLTGSTEPLAAGDIVVQTGGFLDGTAKLDDLRGGQGIVRGKIQITDRSGESRVVDLRFASTIDDVLQAINNTEGLKVSASVDGDRIVLKDLTGETASNLVVSEVGEGITASSLGLSGIDVASNSASSEDLAFLNSTTRLSNLRDGRGLRFGNGNDLNITLRDGTELAVDLNKSADGDPTTVGQLLERLNAIEPTKFKAQIQSSGNGIEFIDLTTGSGEFVVEDANGNVAADLGVEGSTSLSKIVGDRVISGLRGPLLSSLNGGKGVDSLGDIAITNRAGTTTQIDLKEATSLDEVLEKINSANAGVIATLNASKTGISIQDTTNSTSSNLVIANVGNSNTATKLKIEFDAESSNLDSGSIGLQFVHENKKLSELNQGRGISFGEFTITDSTGLSAKLNFGSNTPKTVGDVLKRINDLNIGVEARLNDSGDGFYLIDTAGGTGKLKVVDSGAATSAADLGIAGESTSLTIDGESNGAGEGKQNFKLSVKSGDKLSDVLANINKAKGPITASLLNVGPNSARVILNSRQTGDIGRVVVDGGTTGLSFNTTAKARNATIAVGSSSDSGGILLTSSTDSFTDVVTGVNVKISGTSDTPVTVNVTSSASAVEKSLQSFVDQFNKVNDKIKSVTSFDETNKSTGILFGTTEILRVETALQRFVTGRFNGAGPIKSLAELGITVDDEGGLEFDNSKLQTLLQERPGDVETFFTAAETGFSAKAKKLLDGLSGVNNSVLVSRTQAIQKQLDTNAARILVMNERLEREKVRLQNKFYGLEETISKLQQSQKSIASIASISING